MASVPDYTQALDDLYVSTLRVAAPEIFDCAFGEYPLWRDIRDKGNAKAAVGGTHIEENLLYGKNETVKPLRRDGTVSLSDHDYATTGIFPWRTYAGNVSRNREDDQINTGKAKLRSMIEDKIMILKKTFAEEFEKALFKSSPDSDEMNSLPAIVEADEPGSQTGHGGTTNLSKSTYSWWRNQYKASSGVAAIYLLKDMVSLYNDCSKGQESETPNYVITTQSVWEYLYEELMNKPYQVTDDKKDLGRKDLIWRGIPIIWSSFCPSGTMYMLNLNYLVLRYDPNMNFKPTSWKEIPNQPFDKAMQIVWRGNLTCRNCARQGVMDGISGT